MFRKSRVSDKNGKVGVAITTHNRHETAVETVRRWKVFLPKDAVLVVVDDASDVPFPGSDFRFEHNVGIAVAKNKCLELLEDAGVEHAFLADSDCYPKTKNWWKPYVESPEPHLSYQFIDLVGPVKLHDFKELYRDTHHVAYSGQRGCLLYYHLPTILPTVGGFDPIYGRALYEHGDLADRIHASGLTSWRYADVVGSEKLIHSMDEYVQVKRTVSQSEQTELARRNKSLFNRRRATGYKAFVPYRSVEGSRDLVITTLLTANKDPQRGFKWAADSKHISPWLESMERGGWDGLVLADELQHLPVGYEIALEHVEPSTMNVYHQRWMHIYQYLRAHQEIRWVWCTDGSDVEVLRDPFKGMAKGKLYCGVEPTTVDTSWMRQSHPARILQNFIRGVEAKSQMLNAGVVGGDRETIMQLAHGIVTVYNDIETERFMKLDAPGKELGDMAAFNKVAYEQFGARLVTGPHVTTDFKAYKDNGTAKFKHK